MPNTTTQQIIVGVITGVIVMLVASYLQRRFISPPVAQNTKENSNWYENIFSNVGVW